ncbi:hypothetical protein BDB00DRAFT_844413 [Zychaea mexicana]|uniref:uncharacterized protein n=1 Tax=Zychaea mexicana TaxID=64656 RepID=UPI0022FE68EB|nr:uncharacterized protein BDB00DRAFT_844413 [Zychaea mexicana]KAI9489223.1 hypothetical protein BDB00DRAFT_844413 [Zychaea mexicana]
MSIRQCCCSAWRATAGNTRFNRLHLRREFTRTTTTTTTNNTAAHQQQQQQLVKSAQHPRRLHSTVAAAKSTTKTEEQQEQQEGHNHAGQPAQQQQQQLQGNNHVRQLSQQKEHQQEQKHHTIMNFTQNLNAIWAEFTDRVEKQLPLNDSDFIMLCSRIKKEGFGGAQESIRRMQTVLREIHRRQLASDTFVRGCNMLIHMFITHGDLKSARLVIDGMMRSHYPPDPVTVSTVINGITRLGSLGDIHEFYQSLQEREMWPETTGLYRALIWIFANRDDLEGARVFYAAYLKKRHLITTTTTTTTAEEGGQGVTADSNQEGDEVYNAMIQVYGAVNQPEGALAVYRTMLKRGHPPPTPGTYHVMLSMLHKYGMKEQMEKVYADLKAAKDVEINGSHLTAMGRSPEETLDEMHALGMQCNARDYNTFIASYVKENRFKEALDIFHRMIQAGVEPDVYSYGIILDTLVKDRTQPAEAAFDFYETIKSQGIKPDVVLYTSLISACAKTQDMEKAMSLLKEMESFGVQPNVYTFNSILGLLSRKQQLAPEDMEQAEHLWDKMTELKVRPDTRSFNVHFTLLSKLVRPAVVQEEDGDKILWKTDGRTGVATPQPVQKMLQLYRSMRRNHCRPDFATHTIVINTLVSSGHLRQAMQVYDDSKTTRVKLPVSVYNEIMSALDKAKQTSQIMNIWHDMKTAQVLPDNTSYTLALDACEQLGLAESFSKIRAQRKQDIERLLELDRRQTERMEFSSSVMNNKEDS